jgi:hypothetical protein
MDSCLIKEEEMENYEDLYAKIEDPFSNRWKGAIQMLEG